MSSTRWLLHAHRLSHRRGRSRCQRCRRGCWRSWCSSTRCIRRSSLRSWSSWSAASARWHILHPRFNIFTAGVPRLLLLLLLLRPTTTAATWPTTTAATWPLRHRHARPCARILRQSTATTATATAGAEHTPNVLHNLGAESAALLRLWCFWSLRSLGPPRFLLLPEVIVGRTLHPVRASFGLFRRYARRRFSRSRRWCGSLVREGVVARDIATTRSRGRCTATRCCWRGDTRINRSGARATRNWPRKALRADHRRFAGIKALGSGHRISFRAPIVRVWPVSFAMCQRPVEGLNEALRSRPCNPAAGRKLPTTRCWLSCRSCRGCRAR